MSNKTKLNLTKLNLNRETLLTLDPGALTLVQGGAGGFISNYICPSNNGGGQSCGYCPGTGNPPPKG
jgi:hypothetical protein